MSDERDPTTSARMGMAEYIFKKCFSGWGRWYLSFIPLLVLAIVIGKWNEDVGTAFLYIACAPLFLLMIRIEDLRIEYEAITTRLWEERSAAEPAASTIPHGWFPDPVGRFEYRYWDGAAWTEHVATDGEQDLDPIT